MTKNTNLQIFVVVIDQRDEDLFDRLENSSDAHELVWGLRNKDSSVWTKINYGDIICMTLENASSFALCGKINKTNISTELPKRWGRDARTLQMTHMIYFTKLQNSNGLLDGVRKYVIQKKLNAPGVYKILEKDIKNAKPVENTEHSIKLPMDLDGPPASIKYEIVRFIRDTQKSRLLKKIYKNKCQVCSYRLEIGTKIHYSEVHHIRPLNEGGDDDFNNMVVLCPTHHAEFDYGVICIDEDLTHVVDKNFRRIGTITVAAGHSIGLDNIKHNLRRVFAR